MGEFQNSSQGRPPNTFSAALGLAAALSLAFFGVRATPSPLTPNQPPANPNALLPGYGNLAPAYVVPTWYAPLAQAQYAETRAAGRAARYAACANRANAPPQQHHLAQGISLDN
jgi:hypothetical protein